MENLLKPDVGLMFWTIVTFLIMVLILKRLAWKPLIKVIDERELKIKQEMESAQKNREEMEKLKNEYEKQMSEIESRARALLAEAEQKGNKAREQILQDAESEARKLAEKTREQLEFEKEKLIQELRNEAGQITILATERLLKQTVDKKVQEKFLQDFIKSLESSPKKDN